MTTVRKINSSAMSQLALLEALNERLGLDEDALKAGFDIAELIASSGLSDADEVQRYLYILEGQRMVRPVPEGDLTSSVWRITDTGLDALKKFKNQLKAA